MFFLAQVGQISALFGFPAGLSLRHRQTYILSSCIARIFPKKKTLNFVRALRCQERDLNS
ncbi:hypothetical protein QUA89_32445 [Microcoleus sp. F10-B4]|uniref:hypothetical protein n=1 Tax=unclassified Microcoleus TaxID=2642155 RepID=UPI002FD57373